MTAQEVSEYAKKVGISEAEARRAIRRGGEDDLTTCHVYDAEGNEIIGVATGEDWDEELAKKIAEKNRR